ncbi:MAG: Gfo/Idh/MocA family protein [Planctomycetota bacterium]
MRRSAFLGCGPRARGHARAYEYVTKGVPAAACDMDVERLESFGRDFGIGNTYTDVHEMLLREKPDLLHIVTGPTLRVPLMTIASDHEVPVVIVEKPIAVQGEDWMQLEKLRRTTNTRFVVNTQLHFHQRNLELKRYVADGRIGDVRHIDASARSTILDQGVHVLELAHSYAGFARPTKVFAQVSGADAIPTQQPSPDTAQTAVEFETGVGAQMATGHFAPKSNPDDAIYHHKRIAVYGAKGFVHWTMVGWERFTAEDGYESGTHNYGIEDGKAQGRLTDAAFGLLEDGALQHGTRLELSLIQFNVILGAYMSALRRKPIDLPCSPDGDLIGALERALS